MRNHLCFSVCPDPVDKYLEETSVRYISPRGVHSKDSVPQKKTGECSDSPPVFFVVFCFVFLINTSKLIPYEHCTGPQPVICCSPSGPHVGPPRIKPPPPLSNRKRRRSHSSADTREKQTCGK